MANFCLGVYYSLSVWYKLTDKTLYGAALSVGGALLTLVLNFWWIPVMGFRGSAWATFACYFAMMAAGFLLGQRHYAIPYDLKRFFSIRGWRRFFLSQQSRPAEGRFICLWRAECSRDPCG